MPERSVSHWRGVLASDFWFGQLPPALADKLLGLASVRQLHDGQPLFFRGDAPDGLYAVLSGTLRVAGVSQDGKEALLTLLEPTVWFGEISLFDRLPRTHDVSAQGNATVLFVRMADLDQLLTDEPVWWQHFGVLMAFKARLFMINMEDQALLPPEGRLARRLFWMAQSSVQEQADGRVKLVVNQANLAAMLSMSRQTVNRALMSLQQSGVLAVAYGCIEVQDTDRLADIAHLSPTERRMLTQALSKLPCANP